MATPSQFPKLRGSGVGESTSRAQDNVSGTLTPIAQALAQTPIMGASPRWISIALDPAFTNLAAPFAVAAYYKDAFMRVWAKGGLTTAAGTAAGATVATFPAGYRVKETQRKTVMGTGGAAQAVSIAPTGVVTAVAAIGAGGTLEFDFSFLAEQ